MALAMAPPSWAVRLSSLYCSSSVRASGAATCPGAMLTAWGFLGRFMAVSKRDLLTCSTDMARLCMRLWDLKWSEATLMLMDRKADTSSFQLDAQTHTPTPVLKRHQDLLPQLALLVQASGRMPTLTCLSLCQMKVPSLISTFNLWVKIT